jgi:ABC-type lipoprotein release transport system permease subunit
MALLGALGLTPGRRWLMAMAEAAMLAALGVGAGVALGAGVNAYFHVHGLPLTWFTDQPFESGGVLLDPVMYAHLTIRRVVGSAGVVFALTLALSLVAARQAARAVDPGLLK